MSDQDQRYPVDFDEVAEGVALLHDADEIIELRGGISGKISSAYVDISGGHLAAILRDMLRESTTVYQVMNKIKPASACRDQYESVQTTRYNKKLTTTSDGDIERLRWLLIDADPVRATGISSTDEEKQHAADKQRAVIDFLSVEGWPEPIKADSGNGYHQLYRIDGEPAASSKVEAFLKALSDFYSDEQVNIDTTVYNPARITKLYGCWATKGASVPKLGRVHRKSRILSHPDQLTPVSWELIEATTAKLQRMTRDRDGTPEPAPTSTGKPPMTRTKSAPASSSSASDFDVRRYLADHGVEIIGEKRVTWDGLSGVKLFLRECVFDPTHTGGDAAVFVADSGKLCYLCHHDHCKGLGWSALREKIDPDYQKPDADRLKDAMRGWAAAEYLETDTPMALLEQLAAGSEAAYTRMAAIVRDDAISKGVKAGVIDRLMKASHAEHRARLAAERAASGSTVLDLTDPERDGVHITLTLSTDYYIDMNGRINRQQRGRDDTLVSSHPVGPVRISYDIDGGPDTMTLAFFDRELSRWRVCTDSKSALLNANSLINKADAGLDVSSDNAREMARFIQITSNDNAAVIPAETTTTRLGWADDTYQHFVPYTDGVVFSGTAAFRQLYDSVALTPASSTLDEWKGIVNSVRDKGCDPAIKIMLAASLASVLIRPFNTLPFFVHLWSAMSGSGKTVSLILAASVWGAPTTQDKYVQSWNSTGTALELRAACLCDLPLILDEFQSFKPTGAETADSVVYQLSEGHGRERGRRDGGIRNVGVWSDIILSSGEIPICRSVTRAGADNRIIEVTFDRPLFDDPHGLVEQLRYCYGHAGRVWTEYIGRPGVLAELKRAYDLAAAALIDRGITGKQAQSAAALLVADQAAGKLFGWADTSLTAAELLPYLKTEVSIDTNRKAHAAVRDFVGQNIDHFCRDIITPAGLTETQSESLSPVYGRIMRDMNARWACFYPSALDRVLSDAGGFSVKSYKSWLVARGLLLPDNDGEHLDRRVAMPLDDYPRLVCIDIDSDLDAGMTGR